MIDWTKPVVTRDGRKVRVLCRDANFCDGGSIVALVTERNGHESMYRYFEAGHPVATDYTFDEVINAPEPEREIVRWVVMYENGKPSCLLYDTKEEARKHGGAYMAAVVPVTIRYRPGQGLEE